MEMSSDATIEKRSDRYRLDLSQLLWIGAGALLLIPIEAMLSHVISTESNFWTNLIFRLGQIGCPLALYCLIENLKLCDNPARFILWLLAGGIAASLVLLPFVAFIKVIVPNNYIFQLFYIVLAALCVDSIVKWRNKGIKRRVLLFPILLALIVCLLSVLRRHLGETLSHRSAEAIPPGAQEALPAFFVNYLFPQATMNGLIPVACIWYYAKKRSAHYWALAGYGLFAALSASASARFPEVDAINNLFNNIIPRLGIWIDGGFFVILAIPILWRYHRKENAILTLRKHGFLMLLYPLLDYAIRFIPAFFGK